MVNLNQSASETLAGWIKPIGLFIFLLVSFATFAQPVKEGNNLSEKQLRKFNELFFMAEKEKNLGNPLDAQVIYLQLYKLDPFNATVCYELAQIYGAQSEKEKAVFYAQRAVELNPNNIWFKRLAATIYREFNFTEKEVAAFKELVELEPDNPDYRYELALAHLNNDDSKNAIKALDKLEDIIGIHEVISYQKRQIFLESGDLDKAVDELNRLIEAYPKNLEYYGVLAQMYMANGKEDEALEVYQKMFEIDPDDPRPHLDMAKYYQGNKQFEKSIYHLKKAIASPAMDIDRKVPILLSLFEVSANDSLMQKEAYQMLEDIIIASPKDPKAYAIYGDFLSRDNRVLEALGAYKKAVSLEGGGLFEIWEQILLIEIQMELYDSLVIDAPKVVDLYPNRPTPYLFGGIAFSIKEQHKESADFLEQGLDYVLANPRLKEQFYTQLASEYNSLNQYEESDKYFDYALSINDQNASTLNNYAYYLSVRGERLEKALQMTEKSNRLSPNNPIFLDTWAWVLYKKKDYKEALMIMERVIGFGVNSGEVLEHYGDILYKNGKKNKALEQWKKAKELGDTSTEIDTKIKSKKLP